MKTRPIIPYTAEEQISQLEHMAPELAELGAHRSIYTMVKHLQQVAEEEGFHLRIMEVDSKPTPNPLAPRLAYERARYGLLLFHVERGLQSAFSFITVCVAMTFSARLWFTGGLLLFLALACLPLMVMCRRERTEVR